MRDLLLERAADTDTDTDIDIDNPPSASTAQRVQIRHSVGICARLDEVAIDPQLIAAEFIIPLQVLVVDVTCRGMGCPVG